jgi:hypothetical protein
MGFKYLHVLETATARCDLNDTLKNWVEASMFGSGTLEVNDTDQTVQSIYGDGTLDLTGDGTLAVYMGYYTPFDGKITGTGDFIKSGNGQCGGFRRVLRGASDWTGNTVINDGSPGDRLVNDPGTQLDRAEQQSRAVDYESATFDRPVFCDVE